LGPNQINHVSHQTQLGVSYRPRPRLPYLGVWSLLPLLQAELYLEAAMK
jgi:hypothetical protein